MVPLALTYGIALTPFSPLAGGFLTGKYRRGLARPEESSYARIAQERGDDEQAGALFS